MLVNNNNNNSNNDNDNDSNNDTTSHNDNDTKNHNENYSKSDNVSDGEIFNDNENDKLDNDSSDAKANIYFNAQENDILVIRFPGFFYCGGWKENDYEADTFIIKKSFWKTVEKKNEKLQNLNRYRMRWKRESCL